MILSLLFSLHILIFSLQSLYGFQNGLHKFIHVRRKLDLVLSANGKQIENFEDRAAENGIKVFSAKHTEFKTDCCTIRGLSATNTIDKGDVVIELPIQTCLLADSSNLTTNSEFTSLYNSIEKLPYRLSLLLLNEWIKGDSSKLSSYLKILQTQSLTPIHWTDQMLQDFPYVPFVQSVFSQKRVLTSLFGSVRTLPQFQGLSYERFLWAIESVASRAFESNDNVSMPKGKIASFAGSMLVLFGLIFVGNNFPVDTSLLEGAAAIATLLTVFQSDLFQKYILKRTDQRICVLLPFIDSANHDGIRPNCELDLISIQDKFIMRAKENISKNEEIRISYGKKSNDNLFQFFGFIESSNPYDRYYLFDVKRKRKFVQNNDREGYYDAFLRCSTGDDQNWRERAVLLTKSNSLDEILKKELIDMKEFQQLLLWEEELLQKQFDLFLEKHFPSSVQMTEDQSVLRCWILKYLQSKLDVINHHTRAYK